MTTIINNFAYPVILTDKRDPHVSWTNHRLRGSLGGVDLAYPYGASVKAPAAGRYTYTTGNGSGGNIGVIHLSDGSRIELMHLSASVAANNSTVAVGQIVAHSGASGFGDMHHYAAHLHTHLVLASGVRVNLYDYFTVIKPVAPVVKPPVVKVTPIIKNKEEDSMGFYIKDAAGTIYWFSMATGNKRHIMPAEWRTVLAAEKAKAVSVVVVSVSKADLAAIPG